MAAGVLAIVGVVGIGVVAMPAVAGAKTVPGAPAAYKNKLSANTDGWCPVGCDGSYNDYGTIDVVKSSYSNDGGYAASVPGPAGQKKYARVSGAPGLGFADVPLTPATTLATTGCSRPGGEYCTGPYVLYGTGNDSVFPTAGFTSSISIYLDTAWADANQGQVFDWDVSLNDNTGAYLVDTMFNVCSGPGGWFIGTGQNAGGCPSSGTELTTSGWYTFQQFYTSLGGVVYVQYSIKNAAGDTVFTVANPVENPSTGEPQAAAATGGPNYGWFADEDVLGLPVADISLTLAK